MTRIGIVDVGRARVKSTVVDVSTDDVLEVSRDLRDYDLGVAGSLEAALTVGRDHLISAGVKEITVVGGAAARTSNRVATAVNAVMHRDLHVLTGEQEGRLFFEAVAFEYPDIERPIALDVGGGSVQVCTPSEVFSLAIGTFEIENRYSLAVGSPPAAYLEPATDIAVQIARAAPALTATSLVVGSNSVKSFFTSVLKYFGLEEYAITRSLVRDLLWRCNDLSEDCYEQAFPGLPQFMYGSDKLLLVIEAAAAAFSPGEILATDTNVTAGLARRVVRGEPALPGEG